MMSLVAAGVLVGVAVVNFINYAKTAKPSSALWGIADMGVVGLNIAAFLHTAK